MEGSHRSDRHRSRKARNRRELIIEFWNQSRRPTVGANELQAIQCALGERFGEGAVASPASIARVLSDEGAELRHPEVIEFDAHWREVQIAKDAGDIAGLDTVTLKEPQGLKQAETLIKKLERLRKKFERADDQWALRRLRDVAIKARQVVQAPTKSRRLDRSARAEQAEIAEWLTVWIRNPKLFAEWLELRRRSPDFHQKFPAEKPHRTIENQS